MKDFLLTGLKSWDFDQEQGREHLQVYHQTLMDCLRAVARELNNMAKVHAVRQEPNESPAAFWVEGLKVQSVQDLLKVTENVYNHRETPEEREDHLRRED